MEYSLKLFDTVLLKFKIIENLSDPVVDITWISEWINEEKKYLLPLGMDADSKGLASRLRHRSIPKNRAYVNALLTGFLSGIYDKRYAAEVLEANGRENISV